MPSPFPGMDPYLEARHIFPSLHGLLITYLQEILQPRLPEPYFAKGGERIWVEATTRYVEPDVDVFLPARRVKRSRRSNGGVAVLESPRSQPVVVTIPHDECRETWLDIWTRHGPEKQVVATIEILSLSSKTPGQNGCELYLKKQRERQDCATVVCRTGKMGERHCIAAQARPPLIRESYVFSQGNTK